MFTYCSSYYHHYCLKQFFGCLKHPGVTDYMQITVTDVSLSEQPSAASITADTAAASTSTVSALHLHSYRFEDGNLTLRRVLLHCISIRFHTQLFLYFIVINVMFCTSSTFVVYIQFFVCWFA